MTARNLAINKVTWLWLCISLLTTGLLTLWFSLDHRLAGIDESGHIINANQAREILAHARLWKSDWWVQLLTINGFYPPFVYIANGLLRLLFADGAWVDSLSLILFDLGLSASVFGIAWQITKSKATAALTVLILHSYPQISYLSHTPLLDFPLETMIALGIFTLQWWAQKVTWRRSIICALSLALACLTKQIAVAFLLPPALWLTGKALTEASNSERFKIFRNALFIALSTATALGLWYYLNRESISGLANYNRNVIGDMSMCTALISNLEFYAEGTPHNMSPLLMYLFCLSIFIPGKSWKSLVPIILSSVAGMGIISVITWTAPLDRYEAPALIAPAIITALAAVALWQGRKHNLIIKVISRVIVCFAAILVFLQYITFNFAPYPLDLGPALNSLPKKLRVSIRLYRDDLVTNDSPRPPQDWGQAWALKRIEQVDGDASVWLNILPCTPDLNAHTFEVVGCRIRSKIKPTTSRIWTLLGDRVEFSEKTARYYHWYLISDGPQGNKLLDQSSINAYKEIHNYVTTSSNFEFVDRFTLPDNSLLKLYRQK